MGGAQHLQQVLPLRPLIAVELTDRETAGIEIFVASLIPPIPQHLFFFVDAFVNFDLCHQH